VQGLPLAQVQPQVLPQVLPVLLPLLPQEQAHLVGYQHQPEQQMPHEELEVGLE
jgi:hypothetical protein